ncbi:MAG: hypothetical protein ACTJLL_02985 [Anaplasma sp.]
MVEFLDDYSLASVSVVGLKGVGAAGCHFGEYSIPVGLDTTYGDGNAQLSSNYTRVTDDEAVVREIWVYGDLRVDEADGKNVVTLEHFSCGERSHPNGPYSSGANLSKSMYINRPLVGTLDQDGDLVFRAQEGCYDITIALERKAKDNDYR